MTALKPYDKCPACGWSWLRKSCLPGRDAEDRRYCCHAPCENKWHGRPK